MIRPRLHRDTRRTPRDIAADWWQREASGRLSPSDVSKRDQWIEEDPSHRAAWEAARLVKSTLAQHAAAPELMALRTAALAARGERRPGWRMFAGACAAIVLAGGGAAVFVFNPYRPLAPGLESTDGGLAGVVAGALGDPRFATYHTQIGERATVTLPDGSVATLDTNSFLKVAYTDAERRVTLVRGQALFEVAKHKHAPFFVFAGNRRITAIGTKFDVRIEGSGSTARVRVALLEGVVTVSKVSVSGSSAPSETVKMAAGELLQAEPTLPVVVAATDVDRVASWRDGLLSFNDEPLVEAVAEMNRYTDLPIIVSDPKLANLRVTGVYKTGDPEHFAETMAEVFPVRVDHDAQGRPILGPKS